LDSELKKGEKNMKEEKTAVLHSQKSSLETFEDIDDLVLRIEMEISEKPEVKDITEFFASMYDMAEKVGIVHAASYEAAGQRRREIAKKMKALESEIQITPKGQTFDLFKKGLHTLHRKVKAIMDDLQQDGQAADGILHRKQNEFLAEKQRQQAELDRKAEEERLRKEREYNKRIEAAKKLDTKLRLEEEKQNLVTVIPDVTPQKVAGVRMVDIVKVEVMDRLLFIKTCIEAKPTPLDGFLSIDEVAVASYCKKMKLKGTEFPGIKITWSKDAQRGR
jgi:hypothetical protein